MRTNRVYFCVLVVFASIVLISCGDKTDGTTKNSGRRLSNENPSSLEGIPAPNDLKIENLPEGSFIEIVESIGIYFERLSEYRGLGWAPDESLAYYQQGRQVYGLFNQSTNRANFPRINTSEKACSLYLDFNQKELLSNSGESMIVLGPGDQLLLGAGETENNSGPVRFPVENHRDVFTKLSCDRMTVGELKESVFDEKINVFVPDKYLN